ncbi:hypothetical protein Avbf_05038 [Armadillidium vulgare]|nr:hypothetical protein Avbf_05038 [Armadillidium vulgare]
MRNLIKGGSLKTLFTRIVMRKRRKEMEKKKSKKKEYERRVEGKENKANRGNDLESFRKRAVVEYTLPSLENVIQSVLDEDLQRVLRSYKEQHEQIPKETPNEGGYRFHLEVRVNTLGEIISSYPGAFYHYEPLIFLGMKQFDKQDSQVGIF